jgi:electron transport complex protein RnfG
MTWTAPKPGTKPPRPAGEAVRIAASMTIACLIGAAILGGVYMATQRYREAADLAAEQSAVRGLLSLDAQAKLLEVRQYLEPTRREVLYRAAAFGTGAAGAGSEGQAREVRFTLDGTPIDRRTVPADAALDKTWQPLGRMFVATRDGAPAGFVVEGQARGYKNRIRFFVALHPDFTIAGVKVVEHEEDPGLGAEVATPWFQAQYVGRTAEELARLGVTRDPMPEDWREALSSLAMRTAETEARHAALLPRERTKPIYAVTGATISSRALTDGVRATVEHFRRRWELLAPELGGTS